MRKTKTVIRSLLAGAAGLTLIAGSSGVARAGFYAYAVEQTTNNSLTGGTVGTFTPLSSTSAAQVGSVSGSEAHTGTFDALQSYVGPGPRPAENTFTPVGQVNPDYARGDALITPGSAGFGTNNVAEAFLAGAGNSAGSGSWAVSAPVTLTTAGVLTLSFNFTNQLTLVNTGSPFPGTVAADYGYTFTVQNSAGAVVFTSSPSAVNHNASLGTAGSVNLPGSGTVTITTDTLAAGSYTATISGSEHTFISAVPEPGSLALIAIGVGLLGGVRFRKRLSRRAG
jgi:hypothetical protein